MNEQYHNRKAGPNVRKLIVRKMSLDAVPARGGLISALQFLSSKDRIMDGFRTAAAWTYEAIDAVKATPDNPYGDDDEAIAAAILTKIEERKQSRPVNSSED